MAPKSLLERLPEVFVSTTETSAAVSRGLQLGQVRQIGPKVYTKNLKDAPEAIVARHLWPLLASLVPGALIADRTVFEGGAKNGSIFIVSQRKRDIELPGVTIRTRKGAPPLETDSPYMNGLFLSSEARAYLDNLAPSRLRKGDVRRTLDRAEIEARLDDKIRLHGVDALNRIRDEARRIAPRLGRDEEFRKLEGIIASLLGTRDEPLVTAQARARQAGSPFDPDRMRLFELLFGELRGAAQPSRPDPELGAEGRATLAFFEAYFSNYIEGTKFLVEEAERIVFGRHIPKARPEDAHDILGTWRIVADPVEMARTPTTPDELMALLKRRHAAVMQARPDKLPGVFKQHANQAGATVFVQPELVEGTLVQGFDLYRALEAPFARAVYMMFLIAEVHPFADGNGRIARIMMNAELVAANQSRIIIPTVFRDDYSTALKAMSNIIRPAPIPLLRVLEFAQRWVAAVSWGEFEATRAVLTRCHAFSEQKEAEAQGAYLELPEGTEGASRLREKR